MKIQNIIRTMVLSVACMLLAASCNDEQEGSMTANEGSTVAVKLTLQTRTATYSTEGYSVGNEWENYIDINRLDFRIYFFTYNENDEKGGKLIAELCPTYVTTATTNEKEYTKYLVDGDVLEAITECTDFRVVVLANWGSYPSVTVGSTTIDDLCEGTHTTFKATDKFTIDATHSIPFYGVQEFTNVTWGAEATDLSGTSINMLRAVAKVEVEYADETGTVPEFSSVEIVNYNATGYCAPKGVYSTNYDTTTPLHLVNGENDNPAATQAFTQATDNTWVIYLPEYNNTNTSNLDDYSYILVTSVDDVGDSKSLAIYFGNYVNGECTAYDVNGNAEDRFNISRNCYYHFTVVSSDTNTSQSRSATQETGSQASSIQVTAERAIL